MCEQTMQIGFRSKFLQKKEIVKYTLVLQKGDWPLKTKQRIISITITAKNIFRSVKS